MSWRNSDAFLLVAPASSAPYGTSRRQRVHSSIYSSSNSIDDDDEIVEPGKMRVSEIKGELELRGIGFDDCFDKESLVKRLEDARATGKADPSILEEFNKKKLEENVTGKKVEIRDEDIQKAVANDGTLPGGLDPEQLKTLIGNPEVMTLLQTVKMQEAMKVMMTEGQEGLEKAMMEDQELKEIVTKLNEVMTDFNQESSKK